MSALMWSTLFIFFATILISTSVKNYFVVYKKQMVTSKSMLSKTPFLSWTW